MEEEIEVQEPVVATASKKEAADLIFNAAQWVENLTRAEALSQADALVERIDQDYFKLGGVLRVIRDNGWYDGYDSFESFVFERYGFKSRKAFYLIDIYTNLVDKQIPWEKVRPVGWTKLKEICHLLTLDNVDEWVEKASSLSVAELQALLKGMKQGTGGGEASSSTKDDVHTLKFKLKNDQVETVMSALAKAKAEIGTDYDNVALEMICAGYLGGIVQVASSNVSSDLEAIMKAIGWEEVLHKFGDVFPEINLIVEVPEVEE